MVSYKQELLKFIQEIYSMGCEDFQVIQTGFEKMHEFKLVSKTELLDYIYDFTERCKPWYKAIDPTLKILEDLGEKEMIAEINEWVND